MKGALIILDGFGINDSSKGNAVKKARTPTIDSLPKPAVLKAAGEAAGVPKGYQGNSEIGHITIGAGRIVKQMLLRINDEIKDYSFFKNKALLAAINHVKKNNGILHIMGLVQDEGVHAHQDHATALLKLAKKNNVSSVAIHAFTDGRDTPPKSAKKYLTKLDNDCKKLGVGKISSLIGRYYAMDRDNRWNRVEKAFNALMHANGPGYPDWKKALNAAYADKQTDEFITPRLIGHQKISDNDAIIFFNYRLDRGRELSKAITQKSFKEFKRGKFQKPLYVCFARYYEKLNAKIAYENIIPKNGLGETLSKSNLTQLRCAETEKFAHVTYFFNGEKSGNFKGEKRLLIPSPSVATYDLQPEMSAYIVTDKLLKNIKKYDVLIMNFANPDMVGHTGNFDAAVKGIEAVDECLGRVLYELKKLGAFALITADHGNAECMIGKTKTSHTCSNVPLYLFNNNKKLKNGGLSDVAPTFLNLLGVKIPKEMTGKILIKK